jgi:hypothetical protein
LPRGLITSLLIKLTIDYWYFTLLAIFVKTLLIRFTVTDLPKRIFLLLITGSFIFYSASCVAGLLFSSLGFYYIPFVMYVVAVIAELFVCSIIFNMNTARLIPFVLIGDALFFLLLFMQML